MNIGLKILILAVWGVIIIPSVATAQKNISESEYWKQVFDSYSLVRKTFPRQETAIYERFTDGKVVYSRTKKYQYEAADKFRLITETTDNGKMTTKEMIRMGRVGYCREGVGEWTTKNCYLNPPAPLEDAVESHFSTKKNKDATVYIRSAIFLSKEVGKTNPVKCLTEDRLTLNKDLLVRDRKIVKSYVDNKGIMTKETEQVEYNNALEPIEAPIK